MNVCCPKYFRTYTAGRNFSIQEYIFSTREYLRKTALHSAHHGIPTSKQRYSRNKIRNNNIFPRHYDIVCTEIVVGLHAERTRSSRRPTTISVQTTRPNAALTTQAGQTIMRSGQITMQNGLTPMRNRQTPLQNRLIPMQNGQATARKVDLQAHRRVFPSSHGRNFAGFLLNNVLAGERKWLTLHP